MRILVKWPTRGRPLKFLRTLRGWRRSCWHRWDVRFLVSIDRDDRTCDRLWPIAGGRPNIELQRGRPAGKIAAINRDMECCPEWDILVLASDDMIDLGLHKGEGYWHDIVRRDMQTHFPDLDGCLWYSDGSAATDKIATMVIMGRKYYDRFGYIYHPDYKELWCDNEYTEVAKRLGRIKRIDRVLFRHLHPLNGQAPQSAMDEVYRKSEAMFHMDRRTYEEREARNFDLPKLDILMCSLTSRMAKAELVRQHLHEQSRGKEVCVLVEVDDGELSIGAKRNKLVRRSDAEYVCFVDDDDTVADDYVDSLLRAIGTGPDVVTFDGRILWGGKWVPWEIRLGHGFSQKDGKFLRPPNHLCPIRREIALKYPFPDKNFGEDAAYATAMMEAGALQTEVHIPKQLYFYEPNPNPRRD